MTTRDALIKAMDKFSARHNRLGCKILWTENHQDLKDMTAVNVAQIMMQHALDKAEFETLQMVLDEIKFILDEARD